MEKIIETLAKKYDLPKIAIEQVINSMFSFTAEMMRKGDMESIQLQYLGKFCVKPGRKRFIIRYRKVREFLTKKEKELDGIIENNSRDSRGILQLDISK